jgi:hypothetical protein
LNRADIARRILETVFLNFTLDGKSPCYEGEPGAIDEFSISLTTKKSQIRMAAGFAEVIEIEETLVATA